MDSESEETVYSTQASQYVSKKKKAGFSFGTVLEAWGRNSERQGKVPSM